MPEYPVSAGAMKNRCFTVRYAFRPESLDTCKAMQLRKYDEEGASGYSLTPDGAESGFRGPATAAKEVECVLVWNADEQIYELRQLDFALRMNPVREDPQHSRHRRRPPPATLSAPSKAALATPHPARGSATPEPSSKSQSLQDAPSPATTPSIGAGRRFKPLSIPSRGSVENKATEISLKDDFDDLANQLADELGVDPPAIRAIGTAGPSLDDEEEESEEE